MKAKYFFVFIVSVFFYYIVNGITGIISGGDALFSQDRLVYYDLDLAQKDKSDVRVLDLSNTQLSRVPDVVKEFNNLEELILDFNHIASLPGFLKDLKSLKRISVNHNKNFDFYETTKALGGMNQLKSFSAISCGIVHIPYGISYWGNLEELDLSGNGLSEVPYFLGFCKKIKALNFSGNHIREIGFVLG